MCNGVCNSFLAKRMEEHFYCQKCAKYIPKHNIQKEKNKLHRQRCSCCNGFVRNKPRIYLTRKLVT